MRVFDIAIKDLLITVRDRKALALMIAMPLILITILGAALGPMFQPGSSVHPFRVAIVDLDRGEIAEQLIRVLTSEELSRLIVLEHVDSEEQAQQLLNGQVVSAAIVLPTGLSHNNYVLRHDEEGAILGLAPQETQLIEVWGDRGRTMHSSIVRGIVQSFTQQYTLVHASSNIIMGALFTHLMERMDEGGLLAFQGPEISPEMFLEQMSMILMQQYGIDMRVMGADIGHELATTTMVVHTLLQSRTESATMPSALSYYAAGMTVMFALFGAMQGVQTFNEERQNRTLWRLFSTNTKKGHVVIGKTLGIWVLCMLQIMVLITVTRFVFRVNWGDSLAGLVSLSIGVAFASTGFMMFLGSLATTKKTGEGLQNIGIQIMSFLGGCTFPILVFPLVLRRISHFTVTWWGLNGYLRLMAGGNIHSIGQSLGLLVLMGSAFLALGIWRLRLE